MMETNAFLLRHQTVREEQNERRYIYLCIEVN